MVRAVRPVLFALAFGLSGPAAAGPDRLVDLLTRFEGVWHVTGTTLGRPTATGADVRSEFGGRFFEVHVQDPTKRDHYEARVFIGSNNDGRLVVHWLDATGGETSRTLGTGRIEGDTLLADFPYPDGTFHDRLSYDRNRDRWRLLIEKGASDHPTVFSDWSFKR